MKLASILLITLAVLAGLLYWLPQRRKLKLRIEPVPSARLDNTPERSEIIGGVRVRERGADTADAEDASGQPDAPVGEPAGAPLTEPVSPAEAVSESEGSPAGEAAPARDEKPAVVLLEQADLFADDVVPLPAPGSDRPVFAADPGGRVDPLAGHDGPAELPAMDRVLSLHVMAQPGRAFEGRRVLELLLQYGLRFGDMSIFHRHEHPTGQGQILFSLAQAIEPGTFDLIQLERQSVPGVSLFMGLPGFKPLHAFDLMVDTARRLAKELDADLVDEQAVPVTSAQLDEWRNEVVEAERRSLMSS